MLATHKVRCQTKKVGNSQMDTDHFTTYTRVLSNNEKNSLPTYEFEKLADGIRFS